ncbi:MAG: hypothetical protein V7L23_20045 [Nostoc sp.]|uniref:hypothetical protein n=1 Tax=Nostoc sp. TaxID=1180 RepID=UPI002FF0B644
MIKSVLFLDGSPPKSGNPPKRLPPLCHDARSLLASPRIPKGEANAKGEDSA